MNDTGMNNERNKRASARKLASVLAAGAIALAVSGNVSAGHGYGGDRRVQVIHHHYHAAPVHHPGRGHQKHGKRGRQVVHVHHHHHHHHPQVERHVIVERPVSYGRHVVVEQPRHHYPAHSTYGAGSQLNAGALMGAAIGGFLGSQVGGGSGKLAATAAGTIGGFLVGDHATRGYR
jgi:uncharacterized protein YcfJ